MNISALSSFDLSGPEDQTDQMRENKIELFLSVYQSGGMSVYGNVHSLKSMSVCQMVHTMLKKKNIVNIGILGSKITGGTFVNVFANDFLFSESPKNSNQLFSGKRVSASVRSSDNTEMPSVFGEGCFLEKHGMIDGCFSSRLEMKTKIIALTKSRKLCTRCWLKMKMIIYIYSSKFSKHKRYYSLFMDDENNLIIIRQILQRQQTLTMFAEH